MNRSILIVLIILSSHFVNAQRWELISKRTLSELPTKVSTDRSGQIYYSDDRGNVYQLNTAGELLNLYSTKQLGEIYLLEAGQGLRTLLFYQDYQQIVLLDRFLADERLYDFNDTELIRLTTFGQDLNLWMLLENNLILRKVDIRDQSVIFENQWNAEFLGRDLDIDFMKEYQNRLYLLDKDRQIIVFDNLGNHIQTLSTRGALGLSFNQGEVITNLGKEIILVNTLDWTTTQIGLPIYADHVHRIESRYYLLTGDELRIYTYKPL